MHQTMEGRLLDVPGQLRLMTYDVSLELLQKNSVAIEIVEQVLLSGLLLSDHVNKLVQEYNELSSRQSFMESTPSWISPVNVAGLATSILIARKSPFCELLGINRALYLIAGGYGILVGIKMMSKLRSRLIVHRAVRLIQACYTYNDIIIKYITYFKEHESLNGAYSPDDLSRIWRKINVIKKTTLVLYHAVERLEKECPLPSYLISLYDPMGNINDVGVFKQNVEEFHAGSVEGFRNIYIYFQSHFLFRLALSAMGDCTKVPFLYHDGVSLARQLRNICAAEMKEYNTFLIQETSTPPSPVNLVYPSLLRRSRDDLQILRESGFELTSRLIAITNETRKIHDAVHDLMVDRGDNDFVVSADKYQYFLENANRLCRLEVSLREAGISIHRILVRYNGYIRNAYHTDIGPDLMFDLREARDETSNNNGGGQNDEEDSLGPLRSADVLGDQERGDEFFYYGGEEGQGSSGDGVARGSDSIEEIAASSSPSVVPMSADSSSGQSRQMGVRRYPPPPPIAGPSGMNYSPASTSDQTSNSAEFFFDQELIINPLLKQLKKSLAPIRQKMEAKEYAVLKAKGINVDRLFGEKSDSSDAAENPQPSPADDLPPPVPLRDYPIRQDSQDTSESIAIETEPSSSSISTQPSQATTTSALSQPHDFTQRDRAFYPDDSETSESEYLEGEDPDEPRIMRRRRLVSRHHTDTEPELMDISQSDDDPSAAGQPLSVELLESAASDPGPSRPRVDRFEEERQFLAARSPINLMQMLPPPARPPSKAESEETFE